MATGPDTKPTRKRLIDVAKRTLRLIAGEGTVPTPDNYKRVFDLVFSETGGAPPVEADLLPSEDAVDTRVVAQLRSFACSLVARLQHHPKCRLSPDFGQRLIEIEAAVNRSEKWSELADARHKAMALIDEILEQEIAANNRHPAMQKVLSTLFEALQASIVRSVELVQDIEGIASRMRNINTSTADEQTLGRLKVLAEAIQCASTRLKRDYKSQELTIKNFAETASSVPAA